jgi:NTP pyrophosphatase (non-canonical NTP hydrolase)
MTEDEFRSGAMADGTKLGQPDKLAILHGRGVALVRHFDQMKRTAAAYVEPTPYYEDRDGNRSNAADAPGAVGLEGAQRNWLFANDMVYMLDGPEQRAAEADLAFDYVAEAELTLSHEFHGELVGKHVWAHTLNNAIDALTKLDKVKKSLFYGRDNNLISDGQTGTSELPAKVVGETDLSLVQAADFIHGVIGLATEAGELLELLRDTINGQPLDLVNVKEEVGDGKWYMAILARVAGFMWGDDERTNIAKLRARFPNKFVEFDANNRNLSVERAILEK